MNSWATRFLIYSISGIIINEINKNKNGKRTSGNLPKFKGVLEVKHTLPGRIRFEVASLKGNSEAIEFLISNFKKIDGIKNVEVNPILGTLLIKYEEEKLKPVLIIGIILKLLNLEKEATKEPESILTKEIQNLREALNFSVYDKTKGVLDMKNIIMLSLIGLGIYNIRKSPEIKIGGPTALWWAYSFIKMGGNAYL